MYKLSELENMIEKTSGEEQREWVEKYNKYLNEDIRKDLKESLEKDIPFWISKYGELKEISTLEEFNKLYK